VQSYKNALQEWCADKKHRLPQPVYKTLSESGPDHKKSYERGCYIGERLCGTGVGKNQKIADTAAAQAALELLMSEETRASGSAIEALAKIKDYATKNKLPSAQFRDLGETEKSNEKVKEFAIECRFAGKSACGTGPSKQDARAKAAAAGLSAIEEESKPKTKKAPAEKSAKAKKSGGERTAPSAKQAPWSARTRPSTSPKREPAHHKKFS
jgi:dsRNA-specific ribonuclease